MTVGLGLNALISGGSGFEWEGQASGFLLGFTASGLSCSSSGGFFIPNTSLSETLLFGDLDS